MEPVDAFGRARPWALKPLPPRQTVPRIANELCRGRMGMTRRRPSARNERPFLWTTEDEVRQPSIGRQCRAAMSGILRAAML
jgi:hypothetical protein